MNRLAKETSPYLLQHAHNPVDWYPWGEEALNKAKQEDKPILVSIGYAACHWCHVMERESFENKDTAAFMNEHFVNIKIDREERPDLDHIYMDAVQAMQGQGGWPLNVFLTPDKKPFFGGTYFPPSRVHNRASWSEVLEAVKLAFSERRSEMETQAANVTAHLQQADSLTQQMPVLSTSDQSLFNREDLKQMIEAVMKQADKKWGGFGRAPKFPQTFSITLLLQHYYYTRNEDALQQACLSLDKMIEGGIYDHLVGGFARYSTDNEWLAPHFEKMLYDNALLVTALSDAYALTGKASYRKAIDETLAFIKREMTSPEGGCYAALDADSEGVEGKFYVWSKAEIDAALGKDSELFCEYYDVSETGNWEEVNILRTLRPLETFAEQKGIDAEATAALFANNRRKLMEVRSGRIRPLLDDKVLLGWNALMITAYARAFAVTGVEAYRQAAVGTWNFLETHLRDSEGKWKHTYKAGVARFPAFLDDLAYLQQALFQLQEITAEGRYLVIARDIAELVIAEFGDGNGFFFYTPKGQEDVIVRKKELYDGAVPSGNAVMAWNLYYLGIVFYRQDWVDRAVGMCKALEQVVLKYPTSFGVWATLMQSLAYGIPEIALIGENFGELQKDILRTFIPYKIFQSATRPSKDFPLLDNKPYSDRPQLYLCKNYSCQNAVTEVDTLIRMLEYG